MISLNEALGIGGRGQRRKKEGEKKVEKTKTKSRGQSVKNSHKLSQTVKDRKFTRAGMPRQG